MSRPTWPGLVCAFALLACFPSLEVPEGSVLLCDATAECPAGLICHNGYCLDREAAETTPPDLVGAPEVSPDVGKAGTPFEVRLAVTKILIEPPTVLLGLNPPVPIDCEAVGETEYVCHYTATGQERGGRGGVVPFDVHLEDVVRNRMERTSAGALVLDFQPPAVASASVGYVAGPDNRLASVTAATAGTTVVIYVGASEALDTSVVPRLTLTLGTTELVADLPAAEHDEGAAWFEVLVPDGAADGDYEPAVSWADVAGNHTDEATFTHPEVRIKTSSPVLLVDQSRVTYVRSPWGNAATECLCPPEDETCTPEDDEAACSGAMLPDGPYFALASTEPIDAAEALDSEAFTLASGEIRRVLLWADEGEASFMGGASPLPSGAWPRQRLANLDSPVLYATGLDEAGNASDPVRIENADWVATTNPPSFGHSPHLLQATRFAAKTLSPDPLTTTVAGAGAEGADGDAVLAAAEAAWRERVPSGAAPSERHRHAMAYDAARGRVVLFGGSASGGLRQDTWEWDGMRWVDRTPALAKPSPREGHAMAYDAARGRVVLFGGGHDPLLQDTWEWDGTRWVDRTPAGDMPSPRAGHAMAYDAARGRVVLFGG